MDPAKEEMLKVHLKGRDITDPDVLRAMAEVDRTAFIPEPLKQQLRVGGRLLAPIGVEVQHLILLTKTDEDHFQETALLPVRFVPMTGQAQGGT